MIHLVAIAHQSGADRILLTSAWDFQSGDRFLDSFPLALGAETGIGM
ncbi:hypothetical protein QUB80_04065 [Chlorogloeopsis sp. ULAP01]|nr:hypothetical protein [Chlorogloeopsis sp. ULAP01]MDM9379873.1 hypothetical protein [Chlorogloeopsis sp. ULAP01]